MIGGRIAQKTRQTTAKDDVQYSHKRHEGVETEL